MTETPTSPAQRILVVRLEAQHWGAVLGFLGKMPYENVAHIIQDMMGQLSEQEQPQRAAPTNGLDLSPLPKPPV